MATKATSLSRFKRIGNDPPSGVNAASVAMSTGTNPFAWLIALLAVSTLITAVFASIFIGLNINDTNSMLRTVQNSQLATVNASCNAKAEERKQLAYQVRVDAAFDQYSKQVPCHLNNGDEQRYAGQGYFSQYSKLLSHDSLGHVNSTSYLLLVNAGQSGLPSDWDKVPLAPGAVRKLTNPQGSNTFQFIGADSHSHDVPPAPRFDSAEQAADMIEDYWMALLRDVPFANYSTDSLVAQAVIDMNQLSGYTGPKPVTPQNLFRGNTAGALTGPYISQFMYLSYAMGAHTMDQKMHRYMPGINFATSFSEFLNLQNGAAPSGILTTDSVARYIRTGRDLATFVHNDILFQASFEALMVLQTIGAPLKPSIPYQTSSLNQMGFVNFGGPMLAELPGMAATAALKAAWHNKWKVSRRLRPEVFAARVDRHLRGFYTYPLHPEVLNSSSLPLLNATYGSYLLPGAYPEMSPAHPSFCAGHQTTASATVSMLRAMFQENWIIPNPVMPSADGLTLVPYVGPPLTVGGELAKLAENIGLGRDFAAVHFRSDSNASIKLGEAVAKSILRDLHNLFSEPLEKFSFVDREGNLVVA